MSVQTKLLGCIHQVYGAQGATLNQLMSNYAIDVCLGGLIRREYTKGDVRKWLDKKNGELTRDWRVVKTGRDRYKVVPESEKPFVERRGTAAEWVVIDKLSDSPNGMTAKWLLEELTTAEQRKVFGKRVSVTAVAQWLNKRRCVWLRYGKAWWRIGSRIHISYGIEHTTEYPI